MALVADTALNHHSLTHYIFYFGISPPNCSLADIEMQWLTLSKPYMKKIVIANTYRPSPPSGIVGNFIDSLNTCYDALTEYRKHEIFLLGDMNIDLNKRPNHNASLLRDFIKQIGMNQLINEPTHFNTLSPDSLIDVIITNSNSIVNSGTRNVNISDHQMIFCKKTYPQVKTTSNLHWQVLPVVQP